MKNEAVKGFTGDGWTCTCNPLFMDIMHNHISLYPRGRTRMQQSPTFLPYPLPIASQIQWGDVVGQLMSVSSSSRGLCLCLQNDFVFPKQRTKKHYFREWAVNESLSRVVLTQILLVLLHNIFLLEQLDGQYKETSCDLDHCIHSIE